MLQSIDEMQINLLINFAHDAAYAVILAQTLAGLFRYSDQFSFKKFIAVLNNAKLAKASLTL